MNYELTVGIDASRANSPERTGVETSAFHIIEALKTCIPEEVHVILYTREPLIAPLGNLPKNWTSKVLRWPPKRLWTQLRLSWEMLAYPPDVLFVPAHVAPLVHPKKTVMTVHDIAALRFPNAYSRFERWYSIWTAKRAVKKLWRIIVPSAFTKKELLSLFHGANGEKIHVVPHGFTVQKNPENIPDVPDRFRITAPYLLFIGRIEEKKNCVRMIRAFERVRREHPETALQLVLAGKPGYGYGAVKQAAKQSAYAHDILLTGWISEADKAALLASASIFFFPTLYEGFGLPILEAFAAGVPVVTSKTTASAEVAGNAAVLVDPLCAEDIASGIWELLQTPQIRNDLTARGRSRLADFSWERSAQDVCELLLRG